MKSDEEIFREAMIQDILRSIGEDPERDGLLKTPARYLKALREMTQGYQEKPSEILSTVFVDESKYDQMVVLKDIAYHSMCEHHLLPFSGKATVAYIPQVGRIVGLSKLARLVHCFAKRLQVQERMTSQIADAIMEHLEPLGAGVIVHGEHSCMSCRGVRQSGAVMVTSCLRGIFKSSPEVRAEFLRL